MDFTKDITETPLNEVVPRLLFTNNIAKICHQVNKAYCETLGDKTQVDWENAPEWQRRSAVVGVELHLSGDHGPEASHESWMKEKLSDGWVYGPKKDAYKKEHHCLVPFSELPSEQQRKDYLFKAIVDVFKNVSTPTLTEET